MEENVEVLEYFRTLILKEKGELEKEKFENIDNEYEIKMETLNLIEFQILDKLRKILY